VQNPKEKGQFSLYKVRFEERPNLESSTNFSLFFRHDGHNKTVKALINSSSKPIPNSAHASSFISEIRVVTVPFPNNKNPSTSPVTDASANLQIEILSAVMN
ncbi:hypothetical protein NPIL_85541, partial [Nephila pilipes]